MTELCSAITVLSKAAYADAKAHGLYDDISLAHEMRTEDFIRRRLALLVREEVAEMYEAAKEPEHYAEEMADVVIMCLSAAGHMGIDLGEQVGRKMEINAKRPYGHKTP